MSMKQSCPEMPNLSPKECDSLHFYNQRGAQDPKWCLKSPNQAHLVSCTAHGIVFSQAKMILSSDPSRQLQFTQPLSF